MCSGEWGIGSGEVEGHCSPKGSFGVQGVKDTNKSSDLSHCHRLGFSVL